MWFDEPAREQALLEEARKRDREMRAFDSQVTPAIARNAAQIADSYGTLDREVIAATALAGVPAGDPILEELAMRSWEKDQGIFDTIYGAVKGIPRIAGTIAQGFYEELVSRPVRTLVGMAQGRDFMDAYSTAGASAMTRAWGQFWKDPIGNLTPLPSSTNVNLGSGYLPGSTLATPQDENVKSLVTLGMPEQEAITQVQGHYGVPVWDKFIEESERIKFRGMPVSPGRLAAGLLPVEPGTLPYNVLSGSIDALAQITLDPTSKLLVGMKIPRWTSRLGMQTAGKQVGGLSAARKNLRQIAGVSPDNVLRPSVFKPTLLDFFNNRLEGQLLLDAIWKHHDDPIVLGRIFSKGGKADPPSALIDTIINAQSRTDLGRIMRGELDLLGANPAQLSLADIAAAIPQSPVSTGMIGRGLEALAQGEGRLAALAQPFAQPGQARSLGGALGGQIGKYASRMGGNIGAGTSQELGKVLGFNVTLRQTLDGTRLGRLFADMPGAQLSLSDPDGGAKVFDDWMNEAKFTYEERKAFLTRWHQYTNRDLVDQDFYELIFKDVADVFTDRIVRRVVPKRVAAKGPTEVKAFLKKTAAEPALTRRRVRETLDEQVIIVGGKSMTFDEFADEFKATRDAVRNATKERPTTVAEAQERGFNTVEEFDEFFDATYGEGNWKDFSAGSGYTDEEIEQFEYFQNLIGTDEGALLSGQEIEAFGYDDALLRDIFEGHGPVDEVVWKMDENVKNVLVDQLRRGMKMAFDDINEARAYATYDAQHMPVVGGKITLNAAGDRVALPSAQLFAEYLNRGIPLPDAREVRRAVSKISKMVANDALELKAAFKLMDLYMQKIWKPAVLLRVAFPLRVQADNQLRMAASGYDAVFRHPLDWISWVIADPSMEGSVQKVLKGVAKATAREERGLTGVVSRKVDHEEIFEVLGGSRHAKEAMTNNWGGMFTRQPNLENVGEVSYIMVRKNADGSAPQGWVSAWATEIGQLAGDAVAPRVAANVEDAKLWFWKNRRLREYLADTPEKKVLIDDRAAREAGFDSARDAADRYIEGIRARIHEKTGGTIRTGYDDRGLPFYEIVDDGSSELIKSIALGKYVTKEGRTIRFGAMDESGHVQRGMGKTGFANFASDLGDQYYDDWSPAGIKMHDPKYADQNLPGTPERIVQRLFEALASKPENVLSRSPAFRQSYWSRVEELIPFADDATRTQIIKAAKEANLDQATIARMQKARIASKAGPAITDIEDIDMVAKTFALDRTRELLYDLSKRSNFMDIARDIFPFGEAWVEILTRWAKIAYEHPEVGRRFQQTVEGARRSGFISTDPVTGKEVFNYPGGGLLGNWMMGGAEPGGPIIGAIGAAGLGAGLAGIPGAIVGATAGAAAGAFAAGALEGQKTGPMGSQASLALQGQVQGVNLVAASYLPGLGPLIQLPLAGLMGSGWMQSKPQFDWIKEQIFPFGDPKLNSIDDIAELGLPAWSKKILQPLSTGDPDYARLHAHSTVDVMRALLQTGEYSKDTPGDFIRLRSAAADIARNLSFIRGFLQFSLPTGPAVRYYAAGKGQDPETNGKFYLFQTLSTDYRQMLEEVNYDDAAAFDKFWKKYGLDPVDFITSKTTSAVRRGATTQSYNFERTHQSTFETHPLTAYYAQPDDPDDDFDLRAWARQLDTGAREEYTPTQWIAARNHTLGSVAYEEKKRQIQQRRLARGESDPTAYNEKERQYLRDYKLWLMEQHPGYARENVGIPTKASIEQQIEELTSWNTDPALSNSSAGRGLEIYLRARQEVMDKVQAMGYSPTAFQTGVLNDAGPVLRGYLRRTAEWIMAQPDMADFGPLWQSILVQELRDEFSEVAV